MGEGNYWVYYQWNAATAGTGGTITSQNATGSICPKGWKLPGGGSAFNETSGSFYYLLSQYGVQSSLQSTSSVNGNIYNIALSPLYLVRGGWIYPGQSAPFQDAGSYGYYWPSRARSDTSSAYLLLFGTYVSPSFYYGDRYSGRSLRCLIPTP